MNIHAIIFDFWGVIFNPSTQQPNEGLRTYLELLRTQKLRCGIASSCSTATIIEFLKIHSLSEYFQKIVGAEDVAKSKPDPECYLKIAKHFQYSPEECLVIDDTAVCITAAQQAGFQTVLYGQNGITFANLAGAGLDLPLQSN